MNIRQSQVSQFEDASTVFPPSHQIRSRCAAAGLWCLLEILQDLIVLAQLVANIAQESRHVFIVVAAVAAGGDRPIQHTQ